MITVTHLDSVKDSNVSRTTDLSEALKQHVVSAAKEVTMFSTAIFKEGGSRSNADVIGVNAIVLDYDDVPVSLDEVRKHFTGIESVWFTSHSHGIKEGLHRFRGVFPLDRMATPGEFDATARKLAAMGPVQPDACSFKPSQPWYLPTCHPERTESAILTRQEGLRATIEPQASTYLPAYQADGSESLVEHELVEGYLGSLEVGYRSTRAADGRLMFKLDHCLFDPSHNKRDDASIFVAAGGRLGYKCFHNGCADKTWSDVRLLLNAKNAMAEFTEMAKPPVSDLFADVGDLFCEAKPTPWLVHRLLQRDSISMLCADPGTGKSLFAMHMACSVATGASFFGMKTKQSHVVYIAAEGFNGLSKRLLAIEQVHGIKRNDLAGKMHMSKRAMQILNQGPMSKSSAKVFAQAIVDLGVDPGLIVIDTLGRCFAGEDENSNSEANDALEILDLELRRRFKCHIMLVHHNSKAGGYRGASAWEGGVDTMLMLEKAKDGKTIQFTHGKVKDGKPPRDIKFDLQVVEFMHILDEMTGEPESSATLVEQPEVKVEEQDDDAKLAALLPLLVDGFSFESAGKALGVAKLAVQQMKVVATDRGLLEQHGKAPRLSFSLTTAGEAFVKGGFGV